MTVAEPEDNHQGAGLVLKPDESARTLIATVTPDPEAAPIDEAWLRERVIQQGYGSWRYLSEAVTAVLSHYNAGMAFETRLAECVDGGFSIEIAPDGLAALLTITPCEGGNPVGKAEIMAWLTEAGIGQGIDLEAIDDAVALGVAKDRVIARGVAPQHGSDGWLESLIPEVRERVPRVDETGHTDYRDLGEILVVHTGDRLMQRYPPTAGIAGQTLFGEAIPAHPGKEIMYAANLPGTCFSPENPDLLLAAITGQPVVIRGGIMVEPVFKLETVDTASGNIDFDGSIVIAGDVSANMTVRASGDIQVGGVVEMATLEAGGSIVVKGGVMGSIGRKNVEEQHVKCAGSFNAAYVQQARISAEDSIFIDDFAMQCELSAVNHVRVGNKKRGHIIGGVVQATLSITAKVLGSGNRVKTVCEIGASPLMHKQLLEMAHERDQQETQLLEVSKLLDFSSKHPGKLRPEMIDKAKATAALLAARIATLRAEQDVLTQKIALSQQATATAEREIHEGVEVFLGSRRYKVVGDHGPCSIKLGPGGLEMFAPEANKATAPISAKAT